MTNFLSNYVGTLVIAVQFGFALYCVLTNRPVQAAIHVTMGLWVLFVYARHAYLCLQMDRLSVELRKMAGQELKK